MTEDTYFIVRAYQNRRVGYNYVVARPGYMRCSDGTYARDGSFKGGPEWSKKQEHAYRFKTRRAAARVCNKCCGAEILQCIRTKV